MSVETRRKLSEIAKGSRNSFFGKKHSAAAIEKNRHITLCEDCHRIVHSKLCSLDSSSMRPSLPLEKGERTNYQKGGKNE